MTALSGPADDFAGNVPVWVPEAMEAEDLVAQRATMLAHAALVSTSLKIAGIRASAQARLLSARVEAEEIIDAAHADADRIRQEATLEGEEIKRRIEAQARRIATQITDQALDERELMETATVERVANLGTTLMDIADQVIARAEDPGVARGQMAQFMLVLLDMVEKTDTDAVLEAQEATAANAGGPIA